MHRASVPHGRSKGAPAVRQPGKRSRKIGQLKAKNSGADAAIDALVVSVAINVAILDATVATLCGRHPRSTEQRYLDSVQTLDETSKPYFALRTCNVMVAVSPLRLTHLEPLPQL